jgi:hypothetical protein
MAAQTRFVWVMTVLELLAGLGLLLFPGLALDALLGIGPPASETVAMARFAGVALIAIGVMAHSASHGEISWWVLAGLLVYNVGAAAILGYIGAGLGLSGPLLWPAVLLHAGLTIWTLVSLRAIEPPQAGMTHGK